MNPYLIVAGVDYSLNGPAICLYKPVEGKKFSHENCSFYFLTDNKRQSQFSSTQIFGERLSDWGSDEERYESLADWAIDIVMGATAIGIEGYAFGAQGRVFQIAEACGILKFKIYQLGIPITIIPPTEVKKKFSGRGNADKNLMYDVWFAETGIDLKGMLTPKAKDSVSPVSDIVDSYAICKILADTIKLENAFIDT